MKKRFTIFLVFLAAVTTICLLSAFEFRKMWNDPLIKPGTGVTEIKMLSDWFSKIKDTAFDTPVYVLKGSEEGGKFLLLGGTHANEPTGAVAAITLIENLSVDSGTLYIIPWANHSAVTHTDPMEGAPQFYSIDVADGTRRVFRFGSRKTNSIHQWPDPTIYNHPMGGQLGGSETLNLNRSYPGRIDGTPTEQLAYAILQLINKEKIDIACDMHESSPEYPVNDAIVFHQDAGELAITAQMMMEMEDIIIRLEESPINLRGLSHREWGDSSDTLAVLLEVANPSQGRMRGKTDEALVVTGKDKFYVRAAERGQLFAPYDESGYSIDLRAARHISTVSALIESWNMLYEDKMILLEDMPSYDEILEKGLGFYL